MKKNLLILISLIIASASFAQIDSKDKLLNKIAEETCECVNKRIPNLDESKLEKIEIEFGLCIMSSYGKHKALADKYLNVSFNDEDSLVKLGEEVGLKMLPFCPEVLTIFASNYNEEDDDLEVVKEIYGEFSKIKSEQFNVVYFKDNNNREQKMLWFGYFDGSNLLLDTKSLRGKKLRIVYVEMELFDPNIDDYRNFKIIEKIEKL